MPRGRSQKSIEQRAQESAAEGLRPKGVGGRKRKALSELDETKYKRKRIALEQVESGEIEKREWPASPPRAPRPKTDEDWRALLLLLPQYDPWATRALLDGAGECRFSRRRAWRAIYWMETRLRFVEGEKAGQFLRLEPSQRALIANLFGWERPDGRRRYTKCLFYIPTGNGKSTLAAAIAAYVYAEEKIGGTQVLTAGTKRDQAKIVWGAAVEMLRAHPKAHRRWKFLQAEVQYADDKRARLMPVSADASTEDGLAATCVVFDELHRQDDTDLIDVLVKSQKKRREPLFIYLTTADTDRLSPCNEELAFARAVRDNRGDVACAGYAPSYLPVIYEAPKDADFKDERVWAACNPCLGVSKAIDGMREDLREAMQKGGPSLSSWLRYHLNRITKSAQAFITSEKWALGGTPKFDPAMLAGCECVASLDLSSTKDVTALIAHFSLNGLQYVLPWFWVPRKAAMDRDQRNDPLYRAWAERGLLTLTSGDEIDLDLILEQMVANLKPFKVREIGLDPWNALRIWQPLIARGYNVTKVIQGPYTQNEPLKYLLTLAGKGALRHNGHPVLAWMAGNAEVEERANANWALIKPSGPAKIDGIAALVTALACVLARPGPKASVYETRGLTVLG